jgi:hypothetical protein
MILADFRLSPRLRRTAATLARVICPAHPAEPADRDDPGGLEPVVDGFEMQLRTLPGYLRSGMVAGMLAMELGPVAAPGFGRRFSRLSPAKARRWFEAWWRSPVGAMHKLAHGLKALLVFAYYEQPEVKRRLEFHPDRWIAEAARRRLESYGAEIESHERLVRARDPLLRPATLVGKARKLRHA